MKNTIDLDYKEIEEIVDQLNKEPGFNPDGYTVDDVIYELSASSCTRGYDNDGSTGEEIFMNGFQLGLDSVGKQIFRVSRTEHNIESYIFYLMNAGSSKQDLLKFIKLELMDL